MSSSRIVSWMTCAASVVALACNGRTPAAPDRARAELAGMGDPAAAAVGAGDESAARASGGKASGHADLHGTSVQNVRDESYSFTALPAGDVPRAKGQVEAHFVRFTGETIALHAAVTCLSVVGDQAWVGARVTRFTIDEVPQPAAVGIPMIFRVRDLGEGAEAADVASLLFFPPTGDELAHCATRPAFPILRESASGNIQVKPD